MKGSYFLGGAWHVMHKYAEKASDTVYLCNDDCALQCENRSQFVVFSVRKSLEKSCL